MIRPLTVLCLVVGVLCTTSKPQAELAAYLAAKGISASSNLLVDLVREKVASRRLKLQQDINAGKIQNQTVQTVYGSLTGLKFNNSVQFLGVPFATPPVGNLRWQSPLPPAAWGSYNATWYRDVCVQHDASTWDILAPGVSEDCLYMNVYVPGDTHTPPPGGYPILLWFYGGSYEFGSGSFPLYDGAFDIALEEDVIIATINYRLGVFGYLSGQPLIDESADHSVGNYGFQDQRAAMQFLKATATAFSGNPNLITIFGQSAGSGSVSVHLVAPRSWGLFQRAIMESTGASDWCAQPLNTSMSRWPQLTAHASCTAGTGAQQLACLRALNSSQIMTYANGLHSAFQEWSPTIDGVEITNDPRLLMAAGNFSNVPVIIGANADEGTLFNPAPHDLNATTYAKTIQSFLNGTNMTDAVAALYPVSNYKEHAGASAAWWAAADVFGDSQMVCPSHQAGGWFTAGGNPNTYIYFYKHVLFVVEYIADLFRPLECFHASEIPMVFHEDIVLWGPGERDLSKQWVRYWTQFAKYGSPNGNGSYPSDPQWTPYGSAAQDNVAVIDITAAGAVNITMASGVKAQFCSFWDWNWIPEWRVY